MWPRMTAKLYTFQRVRVRRSTSRVTAYVAWGDKAPLSGVTGTQDRSCWDGGDETVACSVRQRQLPAQSDRDGCLLSQTETVACSVRQRQLPAQSDRDSCLFNQTKTVACSIRQRQLPVQSDRDSCLLYLTETVALCKRNNSLFCPRWTELFPLVLRRHQMPAFTSRYREVSKEWYSERIETNILSSSSNLVRIPLYQNRRSSGITYTFQITSKL